MEFINWNLIKHPMNWAVILTMVFVGAVAITLVLNRFSNPSQAA